MIECLSTPTWINPQIDCLLFLQNLRLSQTELIDKFFLSITIFGEFWLPTLVCAIAYWCIDFRAGLYLFTLEGFNVFLAHTFKMLACVYRPWVLDSRMQPSALAVPFAKGYSFPSGHSAMSASVLGGTAYLLRKRILLCVSLIVLILLIGFSRLWLGVHTPQDVVCGLLIGLVLVFGVNKLLNLCEKDKKRYWYLIVGINLCAIITYIYLYFFNSYRIDYTQTGELLVNPMHLKYVTAVAYGYFLGLLNGCFLCRIFCPFNPKEAAVKTRILRGIFGTIGLLVLLKIVMTSVIMNPIDIKLAMLSTFVIGITITLVYPIIFTTISARKS